MRVVRRFAALPATARGAAFAIGNFDGLHLGHRAVIEAARQHAHARGAPLGVITFEPHPREVLAPEKAPGRLTPFRRKAELLEELGADLMVVLPFDRALMRLSAEAFVAELLVGRLHAQAIAGGEDFRFGHRRAGDMALLQALAPGLDLAVSVVPPVLAQGELCSSTAIRGHLAEGRIARANELLGSPFTIDGIVRPGDQRGRLLGFPTANVHPTARRLLLPQAGVYAVRAMLDEPGGRRVFPAVANLGHRPTFDGRGLLLEVHLLDERLDLYGRRLEVAFVERLRAEMRFSGIEALKQQIARDSDAARRLHGAIPD